MCSMVSVASGWTCWVLEDILLNGGCWLHTLLLRLKRQMDKELTHTHTHAHAQTHTQSHAHTQTHTHTHMHRHTHKGMRTHTQTNIDTQTDTHIHKLTHTNTHTSLILIIHHTFLTVTKNDLNAVRRSRWSECTSRCKAHPHKHWVNSQTPVHLISISPSIQPMRHRKVTSLFNTHNSNFRRECKVTRWQQQQ